MRLTKNQINALKKEHKKAEKAERALSLAMQGIAALVNDFTGMNVVCDFMPGDGVGLTLSDCKKNTHIPIDHLIEHAEKGQDITEDFIIKNLSI